MRVQDDSTLLIPDRRGNNRIDTLRNIVRDPRAALLFLIPGVGTTLRINGRAHITNDADLLATFAVEGKPPRSVIVFARYATPTFSESMKSSRSGRSHAQRITGGKLSSGFGGENE